MIFVGVMSGTSLDGIDVAIVRFPEVLGTSFEPYPADIVERAKALAEPGPDELVRSATLANALAHLYASAVLRTLERARVDPHDVAAIGCHGQTVRHAPAAGYTIQLVNGALLAELTGITTVTDFRSRDIAAGGQGAPLVPAFHHARFASADVHRAVVNVGGIANVTDLPANGPVRGFDTGPGNCLLDDWIALHEGVRFDRDGGFAARGTVQPALLGALLSDRYFGAPPPKSTGRDYFRLGWLERHALAGLAPADVQATLAELTARSIADALDPGVREVYVCGGGAHNADLLRRLGAALPTRKVDTTATLGIDPDHVEAIAFAWLAHAALAREPGSLASVTGARGDRVLGAVYYA